MEYNYERYLAERGDPEAMQRDTLKVLKDLVKIVARIEGKAISKRSLTQRDISSLRSKLDDIDAIMSPYHEKWIPMFYTDTYRKLVKKYTTKMAHRRWTT